MTRETLRLRTSSEEATLALGRDLGSALSEAVGAAGGVTVLLSGELGTGKTTLIRGIGGAFGAARVRSPSFTLVNEYHNTSGIRFIHADLYRLEPDGVEELGLDEYRDAPGVMLVEWPERWADPPKYDVLKIFIEAGGENDRTFEISSLGGTADLVLQNLREAIENGKNYSSVGLQPALD